MLSRLLLAAFALLAAAALSTASAQPPRTVSADSNLKDDDTIRRRSADLERLRRDAARPKREHEKNAEEKFPQIKEDFERIQVVNGDVLQSAAADYARVAEAAEEVRRRAARLGSNLFPPEPDRKPKAEAKNAAPNASPEENPGDLKTLLSALDGALSRFVHNPIFLNVKIINPQDYDRARHDLEEVVRLSARVVKEAERLKKAGGG